ncbi:MAG: DHH family phosphoesterase, partial [Eubacteriales bacterium]|nr:DHH family phosphoesterase [Eubacteriales bacterium]MDD4566261.1 DHH family phosphoesterase [Eubacteriales bacterium]
MENLVEKIIINYVPLPSCIINGNGKVVEISNIDEVFLYDGIKDADIFALTNIKYASFIEAIEQKTTLSLSRNEKHFEVMPIFISERLEGEEARIALFFIDVTTRETIKKHYNEERLCSAVINVDNFDELIARTPADKRLQLTTQVDKTIRQWALKLNSEVIQYKDFRYYLIMCNRCCEKLIENRFSILDDVREIETEVDFPATLSIGIGLNGKNPVQTGKYARDALDLALGRGGDQAVIKNVNKIEYYGGKSKTVEKGNKGKSRIVAHAMNPLFEQANRVVVMGHKIPDMDSFGAALGIHRMASSRNRETFIVINEVSEALSIIYNLAKETDIYNFINEEKAIELVDEQTLLVVVDTHRPSYVDCPVLLSKTKNIVVIDHHRRTEDCIENAVLTYMESYASSASELITEMLQYSGDKKSLEKLEVEALLAGIAMDTNRFSVKTGVRTFEAASWLRRAGADTAEVKRFFQTTQEAFMLKARSIANATFHDNGIVISKRDDVCSDAQIINAQIADELLSVNGITASFVISCGATGETLVSARSLGEVNVQVIMEELGGGGHLSAAGAQTEMSPDETEKTLLEILAREKD